MPLRYLSLPEPQYVPDHNKLDPNLLSQVDQSIQQQGQQNLQYQRDTFDTIAETAGEATSILGNEEVQRRVGDLTEGMRNELQDYYEKHGTRGALPFIERRAREYQDEVSKYRSAAQNLQGQMERLNEANAPGPAKQHMRRRLQQQAQEGMFDEEGQFRGIQQDPQLDIVENWVDFHDRLEKFNTGWKSSQEASEHLQQSPDGHVLQRFVQTGIMPDEIQAANVQLMTEDPQMRAQLAYELEMDGMDLYTVDEETGERELRQVTIDMPDDPQTGDARQQTVDILTAKAMEKSGAYAAREAFIREDFKNVREVPDAQMSQQVRDQFLYPMTIGVQGHGMDNISDVEEMSTGLEHDIKNTYNRAETYVSENKDIDQFITHEDGSIEFLDAEGNNVHQGQQKEYNMLINQANESLEQYGEYLDDVVQRVTEYDSWDNFINENPNLMQESQEAYEKQMRLPRTDIDMDGSRRKRSAERARDDVIKGHPNARRISEAIKADNESGEITISGMTLPEEGKEVMNNLWFKDIAPGTEDGLGEGTVALYDTDGNPYTADDYEDLPSNAEFDRVFWHHQKGMQAVWVPYEEEDGERRKKSRVVSDVPGGMESFLINNGMLDEVQAHSNRQIVNLMNTPNTSKEFRIGQEERDTAKITYLAHGREGGGRFRITFGGQQNTVNTAEEASRVLSNIKMNAAQEDESQE